MYSIIVLKNHSNFILPKHGSLRFNAPFVFSKNIYFAGLGTHSHAQGKTKQEVAAKIAAAAAAKAEDLAPAATVKTEAPEGELDEGGATRLVLSGARAALPGQTRKRAIDVVSWCIYCCTSALLGCARASYQVRVCLFVSIFLLPGAK